MADTILCQIDGCTRKRHAKGYCNNHYARWRYYGDPNKGRDSTPLGAPMAWIRNHAGYQGNDCIKWPFEIGNHGYGTVKHQGKRRVASRVMCEVAHGKPPAKNLDAAHSCGNGQRGCMNPRHLSWKTRKENAADAKRHGTWNHGEKVPQSKLTESDVRKIRRMGRSVNQYAVAQRFGVDQAQVSRIINRKAWAWLE